MADDSLLTSTPTSDSTIVDELQFIHAGSFVVWKKKLQREIRVADVGVKVFLILLFPLTLAFYFIVLSSPSPTLSREIFRLIGVPAIFLSGLFLVIQSLLEKSLRNQRRTIARDIDWSKVKFKELADTLTDVGIDIRKTACRVEVADRWCIQFYQRPRHSNLGRFLGMLFVFLFFAYLNYKEINVGTISVGGAIIVSVLAAFLFGPILARVVPRLIDVFVPRLELIISSRVISHLRNEPTKLRLLIAHEFSHQKHRDPLKKLFWRSAGEVSRLYLYVAGFFLTWLLVMMIRQSVTAKIGPVIAVLLGMAGWSLATIRLRKLIALFQELRADLDAIRAPSDRETLAELLAEIPVESKYERVLNRRGSLKALVIRFATRSRRMVDLRLINEQREHKKPRIEMLTTGVVTKISDGSVRRELYFAYGSVLVTMTALIYLFAK